MSESDEHENENGDGDVNGDDDEHYESETVNGLENGSKEDSETVNGDDGNTQEEGNSEEAETLNGDDGNTLEKGNSEEVETVTEPSEVCEIVNEDEDTSLSRSDVITVEDKGEDAPSKTISDAVFFANISEEERSFYETKSPSQGSLETMNIQCTACWKQVGGYSVKFIIFPAFFLQ